MEPLISKEENRDDKIRNNNTHNNDERFQDLDESLKLDKHIKNTLDEHNVEYNKIKVMKPRHPEKVKNKINPIKRKPEWIRSRIVDSKVFFETINAINIPAIIKICLGQ